MAFSPLARAKVQQSDNINLICQILKLEKDKLMNLHDGNITIDMNSTRYNSRQGLIDSLIMIYLG